MNNDNFNRLHSSQLNLNKSDFSSIFHYFNNKIVTVECDLPNTFLYKFLGIMRITNVNNNNNNNNINDNNNNNDNVKELSLSLRETVLRGSQLINTKFVIGVVVYTGSQSKIVQKYEFIIYIIYNIIYNF
jgi:hypothetical protein